MGGMRKTTVYVPEDLKEKLGRAAASTGRSEAELIREGIRLVTAAYEAPELLLPLFFSGDPELAERIDEHMGRSGERRFRTLRGADDKPFRLLPQDAPPA